MKFLIKFYLFLTKFSQICRQKSRKKEIPDEISDNEMIVRGIVHPLFYSKSKNKLDDKAFLPPPNRNDVSVLRHEYTNTNYCKNHIKENVKIKNSQYCGLAVIQAKYIKEVNIANEILINGERLMVTIKATPMINLEMHSDILYSHNVVDGEPNTLIRKLARAIREKAKYLHDPNPEEFEWNGERINQELFQS